MNPDVLPLLTTPASTHVGVAALTAGLMALAAFVHFEALERLNYTMPHLRLQSRARILFLIVAIMLLHMIEIGIFGVGIYFAVQLAGVGHIAGANPLPLVDAIYMSSMTYTTVGYGDLTPVGPIRLILGCEALAGFVLLTWSASFTFLEMQRYWRAR
ncbi:ion channel [Panacagrimonas perspica]|uniref:Ion channel n=1 Tax=Panacagrimonas perspica TaxID=381431 RepID=A0A4R7PC19_9GAMM|nr:potassium channel family protein [Panacagrimonas perspica]TDU31645.1 ion channel [Panacagrimonas perspica]